jgi:hypothetical protein
MKKLRRPGPSPQRGAAALIVVLLLFFVISLVAAYAGRNLIFEQRTSTNQYRSTQAFEAAEAGLEWALAMLNGGPISATCAPSANAADKSFRQRFLKEDPDHSGQYVPATWGAIDPERLQPSCIRNGAGWNCSCRDDAAATPEVPAGGGTNPAFRVCFERVPLDPLVPLGPVQQGTVRIVSTGRTKFVENQPCEERGQGTADDAASTVSVVVALSSALATPPRVGLAVRGNVDVAGQMTLLEAPLPSREELSARGWLVQAGGSASLPLAQPANVRGTPISAYFAQNDAALAALSQDQMFASVFNMGKATYRNQPGAVILNDCAVACSAKLVQAAQAAKGRIIWVDGDMTIEADAVLGAAGEPVVIVASGNVNLTAASVEVFGLLYSHANFDAGVADLSVDGATVAAGKFDGGGSSRVLYRADILGLLSRSTGSFVRVPGSWRDFP